MTSRDPQRTLPEAIFAGPGQIHSLCRSLDWSVTSLGPVESWPQSLVLAVRMCLNARFPMSVWAGPDLVLIYNDGYPPVLGPAKHPWALGRPAREVWSEVWDRVGPELERVVNHGEATVHTNERFVIRRGLGPELEEAHFTYSFTPIQELDGRIVGALNTFIETTESIRSELEREARYRSLFESIDEGFCIIEMLFQGETPVDYRFLEVNPAFEKAMGLTNAVGRTVKEMVPGHEDHWFQVYGEVARTGEPERFENEAKALGRFYDVYAFRVGRAEQRQVAVLFNDITHRKTAQDKLARAAADLAEADRRKNEFLGVLSHELRNPLTPIANSLYILDHAAPGGEQADRAKQVIGRQVAHLSTLVNDLLEVTRITRNKVHLQKEPVELNEVVRRAAEDYRSLFESAGVDLEVAPALHRVPVSADRTRLVQVIGNLLQNASKFTPSGGRTQVSVSIEGKQAVVRVRDTGRGMDEKTLTRVFEPFMQADTSLDRRMGGLGLGLALVRGLVELHGGSVSANSAGLGEGTEVVVRLPLDVGAALQVAATQPHIQAVTRRVLVIEDSADAADSLREVLGFGEHEVVVAYNGPEGLAKAREFRPEVVLCDIGLPGMDGYDVARAFRADKALHDVFLVALSGYALPEDLQRAREAGFDQHLAKPPSPERLEALLAEVGPALGRDGSNRSG